MRFVRSKLLLACAAALAPGLAQAQVGSIGSYSQPRVNPNPTYSPYLNLTRPGAAATNYYGIVRPQIDAMRTFQQLQANALGGSASIDPSAIDPSLPPGIFGDPTVRLQTGHPVAYFNYSHFYNFQGTRPGMSTGGGMTAGFGANTGRSSIGTVQAGLASRGGVTPVLILNQNTGGSGSSNNNP